VLTDYCNHVTIVERDLAPSEKEFRKGVPQARHPHVLLKGGENVLEQQFPGLRAELLAQGAHPINMGSEVAWYMAGHWRTLYESALVNAACSRPLLEATVYRRLSAHPKISVRHQTDVVGLCADTSKTRITSVELRNRQTQQITTLEADLVVDASGRDSDAPQWLEALGYARPVETSVTAKPGYATRIYEMPAKPKESWKALYIQPSVPNTRGGILTPMEGNRWHVTMIGMGGDYPPTTEEGYLEFARSLPSQRLYEAIKDAKPLTDVYGYRRGENRLRHYEKMPRYLEGFLVSGDAVFAFNPVYGQGMTTAALSSMALDQCLREQRNGAVCGLAQRFQKQLMKVIAAPWQLATSEDMRWKADPNNAAPDFPTRMMQGYIGRMLQASMVNVNVAEAFFRVQQMIEPPTLLFNPSIVWQVLTTRTTTSAPRAEDQFIAQPARALSS
jgi:2-polyprenyl-6-methoxyphenol hydroxylase-like FAD-dependent oxidoreductase